MNKNNIKQNRGILKDSMRLMQLVASYMLAVTPGVKVHHLTA